MDRESLKRELTQHFQQSLDEAIDAVEKAPDGAWISASEWQVREVFQKLNAQAFERILQARLDAANPAPTTEPAFSPSAPAAEQGITRPGRPHRRR